MSSTQKALSLPRRLQDTLSTFLGITFGYREAEIDTERLRQPFCQKCSAHFAGITTETTICSNCRSINPHFEKARAAYPFKGSLQELIHAYKYQGEFWLRRIFANALYEAYLDYFQDSGHHLIVPVPLSRTRKKERGFNQAYELASLLGKKISLPVHDCLIRVIHTEKQTTLTRKVRLKNVARAFQMRKPENLRQKRILLIDDVITTGSTTSACAKVLRSANAASVDVLSIARA